jgi:hypothetical protein
MSYVARCRELWRPRRELALPKRPNPWTPDERSVGTLVREFEVDKGLNKRVSRRRLLEVAAILAADITAARAARATVPQPGGGTSSGLQYVTNQRTGTTYDYIPPALYEAQTGDTILLPAGLYSSPGIPYRHWLNSTSYAPGHWMYSASDGWNNMFLGYGFSGALYLTLTGSGSANNGRAIITAPFVTLTQDAHATDKVLHVDDASVLGPNGPGIRALGVWGNNSQYWYAAGSGGGAAIYFHAIDTAANTLSVSSWQLGVKFIPAGTMLMSATLSNEGCLLQVFAPAPNGFTFNNIEFSGATSGNNGCAIRQGFGTDKLGDRLGSYTLNNCYIHDCQSGTVGNFSPPGSRIFVHYYYSEFYRNGCSNLTHNFYTNHIDDFTMMFCYSHYTTGTHIGKTRAYKNNISYCRMTGENPVIGNGNGTAYMPNPNESCNLDISNGGVTILVGDMFEQSSTATNVPINYCAENWANDGLYNYKQELYVVNCTMVNTENKPGNSNVFISAPSQFVFPPVDPVVGETSGGSLPRRSYFQKQTCLDANGIETTANGASTNTSGALRGFYSAGSLNTVGANALATAASPPAATGAVDYNQWLGFPPPPRAVLGTVSGGSLGAQKCFVLLTFVNALGESLNFGAFPQGYGQGYLSSQVSTATTETSIDVPANRLLTVQSPASSGGFAAPFPFTAWGQPDTVFGPYPAGTVYPYKATHYNVYAGSKSGGETLQNTSPIPLGTNWTMPTRGLVGGPLMQQGWIKQNASPIAVGTGWTEPSSGPVSAPIPALVWRRRAQILPPAGSAWNYQEWWAPASSALSGHVIKILFNPGGGVAGAAFGVTAPGLSASAPFDTNPSLPSQTTGATTTVSTNSANSMVLGSFADQGSFGGDNHAAGPGYTQIMGGSGDPSGGNIVIEYKVVSSAQSGLLVDDSSNGTNQNIIGDAIAATGTLSIDGTVKGSGTGTTPDTHQTYMTLPALTTVNAGDIIVLSIATGYGVIVNIDAPGPPFINLTSGPPICVVANNLLVNYPLSPDTYVLRPVNAQSTVTGNGLYSPPGEGGSAPGFADPNVAHFNYALLATSPARGAGTAPGTTLEGFSLVPTEQLELFGLPTPGTPIGKATPRPNAGGVFDQGAYAFGG